MDGGTERGKGAEDIGVDLTRVGLAGDGVGVAEARELGDALVEGLDLLVVAVEESEEGSLGTGRALDATETEVVTSALEVAQVPEKLLDPEGGTLADGRQLGGLEVGETKGREVLVLLGEGGETSNDDGELGEEDVETITEEDQVGVVSDKARGGTEADVS